MVMFQYGELFEAHGYDDTSFIVGMTEKQLENMGVTSKPHRNAIMDAIKHLPEHDIYPTVPVRDTKFRD